LIESGTIPGLDRPLAKIGLAEKGYVNVELTAEGEGGGDGEDHEEERSHGLRSYRARARAAT
jgi:hypothetical protein